MQENLARSATADIKTRKPSSPQSTHAVPVASSGTYLTGTLYLADNMEFCVEAGAMLLVSSDCCDYNADDLIIENMILRWGELRKAWCYGLSFRHVKGLKIEGGSIRQPLPGIGAAIHVQQCDDVCVRRVSAAHGTAIFFQAEDMPRGAKICCVDNDLREAETAFDPQLIPLLIDKIGNLTSSK